jgi:hypothetical protein
MVLPSWPVIGHFGSVARSFTNASSSLACAPQSKIEARMNGEIKRVNLSNMTRVLFIRDPFERAHSAYTNSKKNKHLRIGRYNSSADCTFGQWVDAIANDTEVAFKNEHFRPQVNMAQMDKMHYHYHLRMSSSVDQEFFWNNLLGMTKSINANKSEKNNSAPSDIFKSIDSDTFKKLALIYDADLKQWKRVLKQGTPRQAGEVTIFDLYNAADRQ